MPLVTTASKKAESEEEEDSSTDTNSESEPLEDATPAHQVASSAPPAVCPFPGPRRSCVNGLCRAAPPPAAVAFCAIQLEVAEEAPDIDFYFNRGKSLEDVFHTLRLDLPTWCEPQARRRGILHYIF